MLTVINSFLGMLLAMGMNSAQSFYFFEQKEKGKQAQAQLVTAILQWRLSWGARISSGMTLWRCQVRFKFPIVKLLDRKEQWSTLETSRNPFAPVVMAHLKAQETRRNRTSRLQWKLSLLYEQGFSREDILELFRFINWLLALPEDLEHRFDEKITHYEEEKQMPYITSVERIGIQKGMLQNAREAVLDVLEARFATVPSAVVGAHP